jgi:putative endonuclease
MAEHNLVGEKGEAIALAYLREKGYHVRETNWRFKKAEIDIIAEHKEQIVVVEVKTRTSKEFERPQEAVTITKQKHLVRAADAYIQEYNIDLECRFDIISVLIFKGETEIEHIEDAFYPML